MRFGDRLKQLREHAGLTQQELADKANIQVGRLRNHEQNMREPVASMIFAYAKALETTCEAFAGCTFENRSQTQKETQKKKR